MSFQLSFLNIAIKTVKTVNAAVHVPAKNMGVQKRIMAVVLPSPANHVCLNALGTRRVVGFLNTYWTNNKIRSAEVQNKRET